MATYSYLSQQKVVRQQEDDKDTNRIAQQYEASINICLIVTT
jgi:hypothetical protein